MEICTDTSTRGTTLLSRVVLAQQPGGVVRPQAAPTTWIDVAATAAALGRRGRALTCDPAASPFAACVQGGAVAGSGAAAVIDHLIADRMVADSMVTDHPYSTRLGPLSCSPPV